MTVTTITVQVATQQLQTLTQQLLCCAQAGDWDVVAELERQRKPILFKVFNTAGQMTSSARSELLNEILTVDNLVLELAEQRKGELAGLLRKTGQGRTVLKAYDAHSR